MLYSLNINIRDAINAGDFDYPTLGSAAQSGSALGSIVSTVVTVAIILAALFMLFQLIRGGYSWLTAGGDKGKIEEARGQITNGLIGLAIVASSFAVYSIVTRFFGIGEVSTNSRSVGDGSCRVGCPDNIVCQNTVCVMDPLQKHFLRKWS